MNVYILSRIEDDTLAEYVMDTLLLFLVGGRLYNMSAMI